MTTEVVELAAGTEQNAHIRRGQSHNALEIAVTTLFPLFILLPGKWEATG